MVYKDQSEIITEFGNVPDASARSVALKSHTDPAAPGGTLFRCVAVSFCVLCVLQAALNISLHHALYLQQNSERDELKKKLDDFDNNSLQGWIYFNGSFYHISSIKKTWQGSRDECLQRGADLMIINSKEEQEFTRHYRKIMWIGLTDGETEGVWKWVDDTQLTTNFWSSGEPNSYRSRNEDCAEINYNDDKNSWNDAVCDNENFWICEKKMSL